ncbi:MAG: hypothetical protein M0C28_09690 [Candidatus Moduliflexus flocculans]|nr:hypothetical protein [Candidatus Moduliflexus flocculans]
MIELSKELSIPLVATNDCHYLNASHAEAHNVLLCIQTGKTIEDKDQDVDDIRSVLCTIPGRNANAFCCNAGGDYPTR